MTNIQQLEANLKVDVETILKNASGIINNTTGAAQKVLDIETEVNKFKSNILAKVANVEEEIISIKAKYFNKLVITIAVGAASLGAFLTVIIENLIKK